MHSEGIDESVEDYRGHGHTPGGKLTRDRHSHSFRKKHQSSPVTVCSLSRKLQDEENDGLGQSLSEKETGLTEASTQHRVGSNPSSQPPQPGAPESRGCGHKSSPTLRCEDRKEQTGRRFRGH